MSFKCFPAIDSSQNFIMCLSSVRLFFSDFSLSQRTQACSNVMETGSPSLDVLHDSAFILSCSSCACCLSDVPRDCLTLFPPAVVKLAYQISPLRKIDMIYSPHVHLPRSRRQCAMDCSERQYMPDE